MRHHTSILIPVFLAVVLAAAPPLAASRVRVVGLAEMTARAERIVAGRCTDVATVHDAKLGQDVTVVTFEVARALKGAPGPELKLRMLAGVAGLPRFYAGEEVILFLSGESALGLASPIGLDQGKFTVVVDKLGRKVAWNGVGNRRLLRDLPPDVAAQGVDGHAAVNDLAPLSADSLLEAVERLGERNAAREDVR